MRKRYQFIIFLACVIYIFGLYHVAMAKEIINNFNTKIEIKSDSSIIVTEMITYDFGGLQRHGIYRDITHKYKARGGNYNLRLNVLSVTDEAGIDYNYTVSNLGENKRIKIGDADKYVTGEKTYIITYEVERALNEFLDHDELYWNVTGNNWKVPIGQASATVVLPDGVEISAIALECFTGDIGSAKKCDIAEIDKDGLVAFNQASASSSNTLTIVVGWPKGVVIFPSWQEKLKDILIDNYILCLPLIVLLVMIYLWRRFGRDPEGRGTVIPEYEPPKNMTPAEIGALVDEKVDNRDLSAEIIYLATKGYLKVERVPGEGFLKKDDFKLIKIKEADGDMKNFDQYIFKSLFEDGDEVNLSKLKNKFYTDWEKAKKLVMESLVEVKFFDKKPAKVQGLYLTVGILIIIFGVVTLGWFALLGLVSFGVSGIIVIAFSFFMPVKTKEGSLSREYILGFKDYLSVAEKDRIDFHNDPKSDPKKFELFLPFAMALGVEGQWSKKFEGIYKGSPGWYSDPSGNAFSAMYLAGSMQNFNNLSSANLSSRPSSSASGGGSGFSGGFSGGGFGGGGGGSW